MMRSVVRNCMLQAYQKTGDESCDSIQHFFFFILQIGYFVFYAVIGYILFKVTDVRFSEGSVAAERIVRIKKTLILIFPCTSNE